jgi:hypothetical protein
MMMDGHRRVRGKFSKNLFINFFKNSIKPEMVTNHHEHLPKWHWPSSRDFGKNLCNPLPPLDFLPCTSITSDVRHESLFWKKLWLNLKLFLQRKTFFLFQITYVPQENIEVIRNTKIVHPQVITYFKSSKQSTEQISTFDWISDQNKKSNIMLSSENTYKLWLMVFRSTIFSNISTGPNTSQGLGSKESTQETETRFCVVRNSAKKRR